MESDFDRYEELGKEISDFLSSVPGGIKSMTDQQRKKLDELLGEQGECIVLIKDKLRI